MEKDENPKKEIKKVKIISLIIICILCLIILILLLFYKKDYHKTKAEQTTTTGEQVSSTTTAMQNNNLHKNSLLKNDTYESEENIDGVKMYTYDDISNYKNFSTIKLNNKLKLFDKNYSKSFSNLEFIQDNELKLSNEKVYYKDKTVCDFTNSKYITFRQRDVVETSYTISFYGYFINSDKTNIYECNFNDINSSNKLIYSYETDKYNDFLYVYQDDIYIKDKNDNAYNIYDSGKVSNTENIFKKYNDITFYTNGNLYYNTSELIGNYDFRKIIYINSGCDAPSSILIISSDNRLVSSMHGSDYKKFDKKFTDIYVNDISNRVVTVEFEDGTTENLDFGGC